MARHRRASPTRRHLNEVGDAIEDAHRVAAATYGILTDYVGHGIGRTMHEEPPVFNYRVRRRGPDVKPGLVVAIEPMVGRGRDRHATCATTTGRSRPPTAPTPRTGSTRVAVHADGIWVLTAEDGGAAGLAPFGVVPVPIA